MNNVSPRAMRDDGKSLLKISAENDGDSSKPGVRRPDILK
jgi:hypothetical protein